MSNIKSYANSYLYTRIPNYERNILEFVMKSERIDKQTEAFSGIVSDVKRRQTSAVLSRVLMREDVILCSYNKPLPASFKVFACKDVKNDGILKVFIDCSGLIIEKNGFLVCNKIDILCTYLLSAMTMIVYHSEPLRLVNNSTIVQSGTECFVSLSSHIFDYLRLNGYAENRTKISYILAMYFQVNMLGLDREDNSTKNLAAKVAGVQLKDINAMEIYYSDDDLLNIDTLLNNITKTFKTNGMTTDVFVEKWNWFYGTGTHFACELFTAFATMITNAYCGSYINNQKTIEKCCGRSMVEFTNAILRVGSETIDNGGFRYESSIDRESYDKNRSVVQEGLFGQRLSKELSITSDDIYGVTNFDKKMGEAIKLAKSDKEKSKFVQRCFQYAAAATDPYFLGTKNGYKNFVSLVIKKYGKYLTVKDKEKVINMLQRAVTNCTKQAANGDKSFQSSDAKKILADAKLALKILDPKNAVLAESFHQE